MPVSHALFTLWHINQRRALTTKVVLLKIFHTVVISNYFSTHGFLKGAATILHTGMSASMLKTLAAILLFASCGVGAKEIVCTNWARLTNCSNILRLYLETWDWPSLYITVMLNMNKNNKYTTFSTTFFCCTNFHLQRFHCCSFTLAFLILCAVWLLNDLTFSLPKVTSSLLAANSRVKRVQNVAEKIRAYQKSMESPVIHGGARVILSLAGQLFFDLPPKLH